jgi:hypothetical protein
VDVRIEIAGSRVACSAAGGEVLSTSVEEFLAAVQDSAEQAVLPEPIPEGVILVRRRGPVVALVVEDPPQARTVRWLAEGSRMPKGPGATYETVRLSFPFVVLVLAFRNGALTGFQQCFYRTAPVRSLDDSLLFPNLYNVRPDGAQQCWLCLKGLDVGLEPLPWRDKIGEIRRHLWTATFNRSVEMGGVESYWQRMRRVDPRVASVERWAAATARDPFFALGVPWVDAGRSVGNVMAEAMRAASPRPAPRSAMELAALLMAQPGPERPRRGRAAAGGEAR